MTKFAFEVPHAHLEDFEDLQDFHFALSMFCSVSMYRNFYRRQSMKGVKQVWLDNSFNEKGRADDPIRLITAANQIYAHRVIAPDNPKWTTSRITSGVQDTALYFPTSKIIAVVNSQFMMSQLYSQGVRNFALSYHVRRDKDWDNSAWAYNCHFLGLCSIEEIIKIKPPTCDTSRPIKLALQGITLRKWHEEGCRTTYHPPGDKKRPYFSIRMSSPVVDLARSNIIQLKEAVK